MDFSYLSNINNITINDDDIKIYCNGYDGFYSNKLKLEAHGFKLVKNIDRGLYLFQGDKKLYLNLMPKNNKTSIKMPDYNNCMVNITSSFKKYYGLQTDYNSLNTLDNYLNEKKYNHILFLILDGLGPYIINKTLSENAFLRKNMVQIISAVFPPTTACAIPVSESGKLSVETGWLGWENYFEDINKSLVLFNGNYYETNEPSGINVRKKYLPYEIYYEKFNVNSFSIGPEFKQDGYNTFHDMLNRFVQITKQNETSFTYAYWDQPDKIMHEQGTNSIQTKQVIENLNFELEELKNKIDDRTLLVITADHGHQDVEMIKLYEFEDIMELLNRTPSNESRSLCFSVKEGKHNEFKRIFNMYFGTIFDLYSKQDLLNKGLLTNKNIKNINSYLNTFLGDFMAVAKDQYYFSYVDKQFVFKSTHAGLTKNEMETPLIIYNKSIK